jgi:hypothetical protein
MKTYILMVSTKFPSGNIKHDKPTGFVEKIKAEVKIHTIRQNFPLWKKRFVEIEAGKATLSIRVWSGKPYRSKQVEVFALDRKDGIGVQGLYFDSNNLLESFVSHEDSESKYQTYISPVQLAINDGLNFAEFQNWFKDRDLLNEPMAIIHFTKFRY